MLDRFKSLPPAGLTSSQIHKRHERRHFNKHSTTPLLGTGCAGSKPVSNTRSPMYENENNQNTLPGKITPPSKIGKYLSKNGIPHEKMRQLLKDKITRKTPPNAQLCDIYNTSLTDKLHTFSNYNIVIGETHSDIAPKLFLITQMANLKSAGYSVLFMEHLYSHQHQEILSRAFKDFQDTRNLYNLEQNLQDIKQFLEDKKGAEQHIIHRHHTNHSYYYNVVKHAISNGIQVIAIDSEEAYTQKSSLRCIMMNAHAYDIISSTQPSKWIAFVGDAHTILEHTSDTPYYSSPISEEVKCSQIPGLCDLFENTLICRINEPDPIIKKPQVTNKLLHFEAIPNAATHIQSVNVTSDITFRLSNTT